MRKEQLVRLAVALGLLLAAAGGVRAQAPAWDGATVGSLQQANGQGIVRAVATDASGNVFVTGSLYGTVAFGSTLLTANGSSDLFVAKWVAASGTWAWAQRGGGTNNDGGYGIAVSGTSVYVAGSIINNAANSQAVTFGGSSPATSAATVRGATATLSNDLLLVKYTDNGSSATYQWAQVAGGTDSDAANAVAVQGSSVYVAGQLTNTTTNSSGVLLGGDGTTAGTAPQYGASASVSTDLVLAKYTDNGTTATFRWSQVGGGTQPDQANGVAATATGSVYVTGQLVNTLSDAEAVKFGGSGSTAGTTTVRGASTTDSQDLVLLKYQDNGNTGTYAWAQVGGGLSADQGQGVAVSGSSVYVAGSIFNTLGDGRVVRFGGDGTTAGTAALKGATSSPSFDVLLAKYTDNGSTGTYQWAQVGGGQGYDYGQAVDVGSGGAVYLVGGVANNTANTNGVLFGSDGTAAGTVPVPGASTNADTDVLLTRYQDNGSTGSFGWGLTGGSVADERGYGVAVGGGRVYVGGSVTTGYQLDFGTPGTLALQGTSDTRPVLAQALDAGSSGSWTAVATAFTGGSSRIQAATTDAAGNLLVAGFFTGQVDFGSTRLSSAGGYDLFVAKYLPATDTWAWAQSGGGTDYDLGTGIAVSGTSVYVSGSFYGSTTNAGGMQLGGTSPATGTTPVNGATATYSQDLLLAKYTDNGTSATLAWVQVAGGTGNDAGQGVAVSGSSVYVAGCLTNNLANASQVVLGGNGSTAGTALQYGASSAASQDFALVKYTDNGATGSLGWSQVAGGTGGDQAYGVAVSGSSVYVTGYCFNTSANGNTVIFGGSGTTAGTSPQYGASSIMSTDVVLAKYTDNGNTGSFVWSQVGGGRVFDYGQAVAVGSGGSVYVAGKLTNSSTNTELVVFGGSGATAGTVPQYGANANSNGDVLLARYTDNGPTGSFNWSQVGGGIGDDQAYGLAVRGSNVYVAASVINNAANNYGVMFGGSGTTAGTTPVSGASANAAYDLVLAKYTDAGSSGSLGWVQVGGGLGDDQGLAVAVRGQQVYAAGTVAPPATFGPTTLAGPIVGSVAALPRLTDSTLPLPVQLVQFAATAAGPTAVRLTWATASEHNSARFEVERSLDGVAFGKVSEVAAAGTSLVRRAYAYLDAAAPAGTLYYRLRQVDQDGSSAYSPVRAVRLGAGGLSLFPNPAPGAATLVGATPSAAVRVLDALGRVAATATANADGAAVLGGLAPGVYVVRVGIGAVRLAVE